MKKYFHIRKKVFLFLVCIIMPSFSMPSVASETDDIAAIVRELDYLIEYTAQTQKKYHKTKQRVQFNYPALLEQLNTTRARSAEYLNAANVQFDTTQPTAVGQDLIRIGQ